jgi:hypothetical protein
VEHNKSRKKRRCELSEVFHSGIKVRLYVRYKDGRTLCVGFAHYITNHMPVVGERILLESLPFSEHSTNVTEMKSCMKEQRTDTATDYLRML